MRRASAALALLATVVAACGSPTPLSAVEYFPAVEAELVRLDLDTRDLTDRFAGELERELDAVLAEIDVSVPGASDRALEEIVGVSRTKMVSIIEAHVDRLEVLAETVDELDPPTLIVNLHTEFVHAFASWAESGAATIELLQDASDLEALGNVLTASPYADAQLRVDEACRALAQNATGVEGPLTCPGTQFDVLNFGSSSDTAPPTVPPATAPVTTSPVTTSPVGAFDCPEVLAVELSETSPGVFNVSTTVRSVDVEGVSYADAWEVRDVSGRVLGTRVLTHPHANEQPFTRSLSNVEIPRDVLEVEVEAKDSVRGFCGVGLIVAVPHS